jgi:hypothetical protein
VPADGSIPIVLAIDVEPDNRDSPPGSGVDVTGFRRTVAALGSLRPRLEYATGQPVKYAWFVRMDPQVAAQGGRPEALLSDAPELADAIEEAGDVIGLHTHVGRWDAAAEAWVADHANAAWIDQCLETSFAAFADRFGRPCREHRFGDRFSSPAGFERLAALGARADLTPEPGQPGVRRPPHLARSTGRIPSYARVPRSPHRSGGEGSLWLLPLTSADPAPGMGPGQRWARRLRYLGQPRHRTLLLDRPWPSAGLLWDLAEGQLERGERHLAFVIRSDLVLGPRWAGASAVLEALLQRPLVRRLAFVGGEEAVQLAVG